MAVDEHTPFMENIPAYALGALDADEVIALEAHLQTCASCRTELADYHSLSESLLEAVPPRQPSVMLRKRLLNQLPGSQTKIRPQFKWGLGRVAVGLAFIVLVVLNYASFQQIRQIQVQQTKLVSQVDDAQVALAMLSYPSVQRLTVEAENLSGSLLLDPDRNIATLILWHMPQLQGDQTYQVWLIDRRGGRVGAGIFNPRVDEAYTTKVIFAKEGFSNYIGIGVTVEPAGGSEQPTGERVLKVDF